MNKSTYEQAVHQIYDAILFPERWFQAWTDVAKIIHADGFHFISLDVVSGLPNSGIVNQDSWQQAVVEYNTYYGLIDPRKAIVQNMPVGALFVCHRHITSRFVETSEYYQDFLRKYDARYLMAGSLLRNSNTEVLFALLRGQRDGAFRERDSAIAERLLQHLCRAVKIAERTSQINQIARIGEIGLSVLGSGVFILDAHGHLRFTNASGERMLKDKYALQTKNGCIVAAHIRDGSRLTAVIADTACTRRPHSLLMLASAPNVAAEVTVLYLSPDHKLAAIYACGICLLVNPLRRPYPPPAGQLLELFAFTRAEARLAEALAAGTTPNDYARRNDVSIATVRSQIRSLLQKTESPRLVDLVRLLVGVPVDAPTDSRNRA